jgi:HD-GYP domain-containing protein (c-di-GMP phosphodiesterase class II)
MAASQQVFERGGTRGVVQTLARSAGHSGYAHVVLDRVVRQASEVMGTEETCIVVHDRRRPPFAIAAAAHGLDPEVVGSRLSPATRALQLALRDGRTASNGDGFHPTAAAPIRSGGRVNGALSVSTADPSRSFAPGELRVLAEVAGLTGGALARGELRGAGVALARFGVESLAEALSDHDLYTGWHSAEVVGLASRIGERLGLQAAELIELDLAALLHDVGKVVVPHEVLRKPGALTPAERELVQRHAVQGADVLRRVPGLEAVAVVVRFHHERWDGTGYPDGLVAGRIPLVSRIVGVCDAYQAMTSNRPYRRRMSSEAAVEELQRCAGTQFDPVVVGALEASLG